jgi:hypothetical protein
MRLFSFLNGLSTLALLPSSSYALGSGESLVSLPSFQDISLSKIDEARALISGIQIEVGKSNKALLDHPRRNTYHKDVENSKHHRRQTIDTLPVLNSTIQEAAALLAEFDERNSSTSLSNLTARHLYARDTTFWMETISHSGSMPFGGDQSYKVRLLYTLIFTHQPELGSN